MLLSRFWYVVMAVALGAVHFALFLSTSMYDRASVRAMGEALAGDSQVVGLVPARRRAQARQRAHRARARRRHSHPPRRSRATRPTRSPSDSKEKVRTALRRSTSTPSPPSRSSTRSSRSTRRGAWSAQVGFDQASGIENFELGGYPVVADALHGWVRDDSWVLGGRIYRVVGAPGRERRHASRPPAPSSACASSTTPSRASSPSAPAPPSAFYANGARVSSGAPEGFDTAQLDTITSDLKAARRRPDATKRRASATCARCTTISASCTRAWSARRGISGPAMPWRAPRTSSARRSAFCTTPTTRTSARCRLTLILRRIAAGRGGRPRVQLPRAHAPACASSAPRPSVRQGKRRSADASQVPRRLSTNRQQPERRNGKGRGQGRGAPSSGRSRCGARARCRRSRR